MSGRKQILFDESAFFDVRRQAAMLTDLRRDAPKLFGTIQQRVQDELDRVFAVAQARQETAEQATTTLNDEARVLEELTTRQLQEQRRRSAETLRQEAGQSPEPAGRADAARDESWRAELAEARQQVRAEAVPAAQGTPVTAAARHWVADARTMHDLISDSLPHDRVAPGELAKLARKLATAERNLTDGLPEAALGLAQGVYHDLSDLRLAVELGEQERQLAQAHAIEGLVVVLELIDGNAVLAVPDEHGRHRPGVTLDVDHWSHGELSALRREAELAAAAVRDDTRPVPVERLRVIAGTDVPHLEGRLSDIVSRAALRQLTAQVRVNLADAVAESLEEEAGYEFIEGTYAGQDSREAFYAKLRHPNGNEIVVDIAPTGDGASDCVLHVHSFDHDAGAEAERQDRAHAVSQALRRRGIRASEPQTEAAAADPAVLDLEVIRRTAPDRLGVTRREP